MLHLIKFDLQSVNRNKNSMANIFRESFCLSSNDYIKFKKVNLNSEKIYMHLSYNETVI